MVGCEETLFKGNILLQFNKTFMLCKCVYLSGSSISLLTKEELDKIFSDINSILQFSEELHGRPPVNGKIIKAKETNGCEEISVVNNFEIDKNHKKKREKNKNSQDKLSRKKRTLLKRIRKSLISLLQKLLFRKKTDYYRRMETIKKQWVMFDFLKNEIDE